MCGAATHFNHLYSIQRSCNTSQLEFWQLSFEHEIRFPRELFDYRSSHGRFVCVCVCVCARARPRAYHIPTAVNVYLLKFLIDVKNTLIQTMIVKIKFSTIVHRGPGGSVGIATELRAGRSADRIPVGRDFPPVQTGPGVHPTSCTMGNWSFPAVKYGRGVLLTTHPILVPWSWKSRAILLPTLWATTGPVTGTLYHCTSLAKPNRTPLLVGLPSAWRCTDGDRLFSLCFMRDLLRWGFRLM